MDWIIALFHSESPAHAVLALSLVVALGLALGQIKVFGINLGVAGVLFAGLALGHFGLALNAEVLEFVREFGLILFVFAIGLQVGPGFFASFKKHGFALNALAALGIGLGTAIAVGVHKFAEAPLPAAVGLLSGATTNTPSLAAAGQALRQMPDVSAETLALPGQAYAIAYPFGIVGTILAMLAIRAVFRVNVAGEARDLEEARRKNESKVSALTLRVENPNLAGKVVAKIPGLIESRAVISRLQRGEESWLARPDTVLALGDLVTVVAPVEHAETLRVAIGEFAPVETAPKSSPLTARRVLVTKKNVLGKRVADLALPTRFEVNVTRVSRADQEFTATSDLALQFGDMLTLVGREDAVGEAGKALGDSPKELNQARLAPIFVGIGLGVLLGSLPLAIPGLPAAIKLGLAGGPLIVAMVLSRIGHLGSLVWYLPPSANQLMREMGIALFLGCVGLRSGGSFAEVLLRGDGVQWLLLGTLITFVPILISGVLARLLLKLNFVSLCGLLAGSMTDPPALAFANTVTASEGASVAYATVYPLTMILRVFAAQMLVLFLGT
jgi:putative transport protein